MKTVAPASRQLARGTRFAGLRIFVAGSLVGALVAAGIGTVYLIQFPAGIRAALRHAAVDRGYGVYGGKPSPGAALAKAPARIIRNLHDPADIPTLHIDIKFSNLRKLYAKRQEALRNGFLIQGDADFVPASIRLDQRTIPVELRLKGDMPDHFRRSKWSFRIHTKGDAELFGLRRFSVQDPATRGYQAELLYHETLRRMGVLAPKYFFVRVMVNGDAVGVMALEEHGAKELLERNGRRDGVIVRLDESLLWESRLAKGERGERLGGPFESYLFAPIDAFQQAKIARSPQLTREQQVAAGLLRAFLDGVMPASEVFDADLLGRYLAVTELWGAWHATVWVNQRFYLNALTMRLEPIGFDASPEIDPDQGAIAAPDSFAGRMLADAAVRAAFESALQKLKSSVESGELIRHLRQVEQRALHDLRSEYLLLEEMGFTHLERRAREMPYPAHAAEPLQPYPVHVLAQLLQQGEQHYVELMNPLPQEVWVQALDWIDATGAAKPFVASGALTLPLILPATPLETRPAPMRVDYRPDAAASHDAWLRVSASIGAHGATKPSRASRGFPALRASPLPTGDIQSLLDRHPFLSLDSDSRRVGIRRGRWTVHESLVIPPGLKLFVDAGTTLRFGKNASLIVHGAADLRGTAQEPVVLEATSGGGDIDETWQGIAVLNATEPSHWSHVTVRNTSGVTQNAWTLTGGITFYRSDVTLANCLLEGNRAEDALNIIHSEFSLDGITVLSTASDGLDSDYSTGKVTGGLFQDIGTAGGADAIDISGSRVVVEGTRFTGISDKAISVGEASTLTARNVVIENCNVGAVSKDGSTLNIADSVVRRAKIAGLMSYVKKPEYGPSTLVSARVRILDSVRNAVAQHDTRLIVDGMRLPGENVDVDRLYETVMKPELRR